MTPILLLLAACLTEPPADSDSDSAPTTDSSPTADPTPTETGGTETGTTPTTDTAHTAAGCPVFPAVEGVRLVGQLSAFGEDVSRRGELSLETATSEDELSTLLQNVAIDNDAGSITREAFGAVGWDTEAAIVGWVSDGWYQIPFGLASLAAPEVGAAIQTDWCMAFLYTRYEHPSTSIQLVAYPREWGTEVEATLTVIE